MATALEPIRSVSHREMRIREETICGVTVRTAVWPGDTGRTPLLMFNGIGASFEILAPFADELDDIEVIAFDVPGTGGSGRAPIPYTMAMLAVFAGQLLDRLGYRTVDVLGVSWGGAPAQQFALQNPRRCRRLVLAATSPGVLMIPPKWSVLRKFMTPRRYNDPEFRRNIAAEIYGGKAIDDVDVVAEFRRTSRAGYLFQQLALGVWSSLPLLPLLRQRTVVMAGTDDPVVRAANARLLTELIPNSTLRLFDDGHLFLISSAPQAGAHVREFLNREES